MAVSFPKTTPPELVEKIMEAIPDEMPSAEQMKLSSNAMGNGNYFKTHTEEEGQRYKWWDADTRVRAVTLYLIYGNMNRVSKIINMPSGTLRRWKQEDWWEDVVKKVRAEKNDEMDAHMTNIIDKAFKAVEDRLDNGEVIIDKTGDMIRVPVKLRDSVYTAEKLIDKRNLLRGEPTTRSENISVANRLDLLKEQFKRFVNAKEIQSIPVEVAETMDESGYITANQAEKTLEENKN